MNRARMLPLALFLLIGLLNAQPAGDAAREIKAHEEKVYGLAFAPDGKTIASAGFDNVVKIWEYPSFKELKKLTGHTSNVYSVAYNKDGTILASYSQDKTIRLWNPADGKFIRELKGHTDVVRHTAFSPDGKYLATASRDGTARLWDAAGEEPVAAVSGTIMVATFHPELTGDDRLHRRFCERVAAVTQPI